MLRIWGPMHSPSNYCFGIAVFNPNFFSEQILLLILFIHHEGPFISCTTSSGFCHLNSPPPPFFFLSSLWISSVPWETSKLSSFQFEKGGYFLHQIEPKQCIGLLTGLQADHMHNWACIKRKKNLCYLIKPVTIQCGYKERAIIKKNQILVKCISQSHDGTCHQR